MKKNDAQVLVQTIRRGVFLSLMLLSASCMRFDPLRGMIGSYRNYTEINGKIKDGRYYEPYGRFSVKVPQLLEPGAVTQGRFEKAGGTIEFTDDFGTLMRIDLVTALNADEKDFINNPDWKVPLQNNRDFLQRLYNQVSPSTLVHQEYVIWKNQNADFFVFEMKEGGTLAEAYTKKRGDALRASLSFIHNESCFTISTQHILGMWRKDEDRTKIIKDMYKSLVETADTIEFKGISADKPSVGVSK